MKVLTALGYMANGQLIAADLMSDSIQIVEWSFC